MHLLKKTLTKQVENVTAHVHWFVVLLLIILSSALLQINEVLDRWLIHSCSRIIHTPVLLLSNFWMHIPWPVFALLIYTFLKIKIWTSVLKTLGTNIWQNNKKITKHLVVFSVNTFATDKYCCMTVVHCTNAILHGLLFARYSNYANDRCGRHSAYMQYLVTYLISYISSKFYQHWLKYDEVIVISKWYTFRGHSVCRGSYL